MKRYVVGNKGRPGFIGRVGRYTKSCEDIVAEEGCERSAFRRAETVSRARGIDISESKIREVTLSCRGEVWARQPDGPRGGVDSVEHRGGLWTHDDAGLVAALE